MNNHIKNLTQDIENEIDKINYNDRNKLYYNELQNIESLSTISNSDLNEKQKKHIISKLLSNDVIFVTILFFILNIPFIVNFLANYTTLIDNNSDGTISIIGLLFRSIIGGIIFMLYKNLF
jgi:hypothetical protein